MSSVVSVEAAVGFSKSAKRIFHDVPYLLSVSGDSESLCIEVEHAEDGQRWRSRFPARFIEEITQRTGNAKKFDVFVRMLLSALVQESEAVYLDVLTARDLEMLRRHANPQGPPTASSASGHSGKRYLILTYRAEFDKVHYPLPLPPEERSEEETLRAQLARMRTELAEARGQASGGAAKDTQRSELQGRHVASCVPCSAPPPLYSAPSVASPSPSFGANVRDDDRVACLQQQNAELADALRAAQRETEGFRAELAARPEVASRVPLRSASNSRLQSNSASDVELQKHREKIKHLQADIKSLSEQVREKDLRHKRELEASAKELRSERQKVEKLQQQVRRLEDDQRVGRTPSRAPSVDRSRPASRSASADRGRPPSRPSSRTRQPLYPPPQASRSRQPSRASSVASSRERPCSGERPKALQRSSSPSRFADTRRTASPSSTMSPYNMPVGRLEPPSRRTPSPSQRRPSSARREHSPAGWLENPTTARVPSPCRRLRSASRDRSPSRANGCLPSISAPPYGAPSGQRPPASLRERSGSASRQLRGSVAAPGSGVGRPYRPPSASRYGGPGGYGSSGGSIGLRASSSSRGNVDSSDERDLVAPAPGNTGPGSHRPGSLFGLAADLGLSPSPGGHGNVTNGAQGAVDGDACDIDARLKALQSFLKQTRSVSG